MVRIPKRLMHPWCGRVLPAVLVAGLAATASGQVRETPLPFDSAGRIVTLTPLQATRFDLQAPAWPASGAFRIARLYSVSTGGAVLAVERESGVIERFSLSDEQAAALRAAIASAIMRGASVSSPSATVRGTFVFSQMLVTWTLYGPLLASLTDDARTGTVMYLAATGASYFASTAISRTSTVTRAQNLLATDGAYRGAAAGAGTLYWLSGENSHGNNAYATAALVGAIGGTVTGFRLGRDRTDAEALSTVTISTLGALTGLGIGGALGGFSDAADGHGVAGAAVVTGLAGYAVGPLYPRRARYRVTLGDVQMLWTGAALGAAVGATPFLRDDLNEKAFFASTTAGLLAGSLIADRVMIARYDYGAADALQVHLGAAAGALLGGAAVVLTEPSDVSVAVGMVTAGAILGAFAGHKLADPAPAGTRMGLAPARPTQRSRLGFDVLSATLAATGVPGRHAILRVSF